MYDSVNKKDLTPDQYQGGATWNRRGGASKTTEIKKAMDRKEKSIQRFVDTKSTQIAVSSAFNGAAAIATALIQVGAIKPEEYWDVQETWYYEYLERYGEKQTEAVNETTNEKGRKADLFNENKDLAAQDEFPENNEELI